MPRQQTSCFLNDGLCQHGCGWWCVTGHVGGFGSDFLDHLRTHVLELILQFDLFSDRYAIFSDSWCTIGAIQYYVAAFWAKRHFNCVGQNVHADAILLRAASWNFTSLAACWCSPNLSVLRFNYADDVISRMVKYSWPSILKAVRNICRTTRGRPP